MVRDVRKQACGIDSVAELGMLSKGEVKCTVADSRIAWEGYTATGSSTGAEQGAAWLICLRLLCYL